MMWSLAIIFWLTLSKLCAEDLATVEELTDEEAVKSWTCGMEGLATKASYMWVMMNCKSLKDPINDCCRKHDDCYMNQEELKLTQKQCDEEFCVCLAKATESDTKCTEKVAIHFCQLARDMGDTAYQECSPANGGCKPEDMARKEEQRKKEMEEEIEKMKNGSL